VSAGAGVLRLLGAAADFLAHPPGKHQADHFLVCEPRPQRVVKRCRAIVLDEEVREPGQRIRHQQCRQHQPATATRNRRNQQHPGQQRAGEVKRARQGMPMRKDIVRPELCEGARWRHSDPRGADSSAKKRGRGQQKWRTRLRDRKGVDITPGLRIGSLKVV